MESWKSKTAGPCNQPGRHRFHRGVFAMGRQVDIVVNTVWQHETTQTPCHQYQSAGTESQGSLRGKAEVTEDLVLEDRFLPFHTTTCGMMNDPRCITGAGRTGDDDADMHVRGVR